MRKSRRRKYNYIYKIMRTDGWYYIGMHSTDDLEDGYFGSGSDLWRSINRFGKEAHSKEILEFLPDRLSLRLREKEFIGESWKDDPVCLNKMPGGGSGWDALNKGDAEHRERCRRATIKMNEIIGAKRQDLEYEERFQENHRRNFLKASKAKHPNANRGRVISAEHRERIGVANSKRQSGTGNSNFGKIWVFSEKERRSISVKRELAQEYFDLGWKPGRRFKWKIT